MKLYELTERYLSLSDDLLDSMDADGVVDCRIAARFNDIEDQLQNKLANCCRMVRNLEAAESALKSEVDRLKAKQDAAARQVSALKNYMKQALLDLGEKKIRCDAVFTVALQNNPKRVEILDLDLIPTEFDKEQERQVRLADILKAIEAGSVVSGVEVVQGTHLRIR